MDQKEQETIIREDQERKERDDFKLGNRRTPLTNNVLLLLGDLLQPQTTGFNHINLDMGFTQLDNFDMYFTENSSFLIVYFQLYGLKKCNFIERNKLATRLIAKRSFMGKSMDLFTSTVNVNKQEFKDITDKKTGFGKLFGGSSKEAQQ